MLDHLIHTRKKSLESENKKTLEKIYSTIKSDSKSALERLGAKTALDEQQVKDWATMPKWTIHEGVMLALNWSPEGTASYTVIDDARFTEILNGYKLAKKKVERNYEIFTTHQTKLSYDGSRGKTSWIDEAQVLPHYFINFCENYGIGFPQKIKNLVPVPIYPETTYKSLYESSQETIKKQKETNEGLTLICRSLDLI